MSKNKIAKKKRTCYACAGQGHRRGGWNWYPCELCKGKKFLP